MSDVESLFARLRERLEEMSHLSVAQNVLHYDMETVMPEGGAEARGATMAYLAGAAHDKLVSEEFGEIVTALKEELDRGNLDEFQSAVVRDAWRDYNLETRLPGSLVRKLKKAETATQHAWEQGKKADDSTAVMPHLTRLVDLHRIKAKLLADDGVSPYDALLDTFEPGMTGERIERVFAPLRSFLSDLVRRIGESPSGPPPDAGLIAMDIESQQRLNREIAEMLGYDFTVGRMDRSAHPFTSRLHPGDTRITTRYDESDYYSSLSAVIHEAGHAMYEQGMPTAFFWAGPGNIRSLGIHESQSRLWENMVGRSREFIRFLWSRLSSTMIVDGVGPEKLYRGVNTVQPSLIRVEADEVTYNLHVCLRFELERALIEGRLEVADLRDAWRAKMRDYLGIEVPGDFSGFLQDVHWPCGYFGYFPTYTIGNLYSAQIWNAVKRDLPDVERGFRDGEFRPLLAWLRENIHAHAAMIEADEVVRRATGSGLDGTDWMRYIDRKYSEIYGL